MVLAGCENKNSRSWIENKISAVDRVYPTKNLYDLFEEFPNGFTVKVGDAYDKDGKHYNRDIKLIGNPQTKTITGKVTLTLIEKEDARPAVETEIESSDLEYTRAGELVLANSAATAELFPYKDKGFLLQRLTLNKKVLSEFELDEASYNWQSESAFISYNLQNDVVNSYFGIAKDSVVLMIIYPNQDESDNIPSVNYQTKTIDHWENINPGMEEEDE